MRWDGMGCEWVQVPLPFLVADPTERVCKYASEIGTKTFVSHQGEMSLVYFMVVWPVSKPDLSQWSFVVFGQRGRG